MTEHDENPDPRVEQMLRRWGNQEAAGSAEIGRPPDVQPSRLMRANFIRWAPLIGAAALLVVSLAVLIYAWRDDAEMTEKQNEIATLKSDNARKDEKYAEFGKKLVEKEQAEQAAISRAELAEKDVKALQKKLASGETENADLATDIEVARVELVKMRKELDYVSLALENLKKEKVDMVLTVAKSAAARESLANEKRLLDEEIRRLRSLHLTATEKLSDSNKELTHLRSQRALVLIDVRRLYLGMVAQGDTGVSGLQKASRLRRMVEQSEKLKTHLQSDSARELFERLEVALIRLEMIDAMDNAASEELTRIVRGGQIIQRIDKIIEQGTEPAEIRSFLFEARLILMGDNNVS